MKRNRCKILMGVLILCFSLKCLALPTVRNDSIVYVWDFSVSDSSIKEIGTMLTNDFETELINSGLYTVLERRRYNRVLAHQNLEKKIADIQNLPSAAMDTLKANRAGVVIFGEVKDDIESGVYEVSVTFQNLNEIILRKGSVLIGRGLIRDNQTRKKFMRDLVDVVHAKELLAAKKEQYNIVSSILQNYMVRVKDVQRVFHDLVMFAFDDSKSSDELVHIVTDYNTVFNEINNNQTEYIQDFKSGWGIRKGQELEVIFNDILNDIHKTHILKLDKVRTGVLEYQQSTLSKKEKKNKKNDILKNVKETTDDLKRQIDIVDLKTNTFLSQLQTEMNEQTAFN